MGRRNVEHYLKVHYKGEWERSKNLLIAFQYHFIYWYVFLKKYITSMIFPRIIRNLICKASAFFFKRECPFTAPASRAFIIVWALFKGKTKYTHKNASKTKHLFFMEKLWGGPIYILIVSYLHMEPNDKCTNTSDALALARPEIYPF